MEEKFVVFMLMVRYVKQYYEGMEGITYLANQYQIKYF